jgi:general stress protein 26
MTQVKNLVDAKAVEKIKELAKEADMCLFVTALTQLPLSARPMSTQDIDDEGNLWFFSTKSSEKNDEIKKDPRVQLFYSNKGASEYLSIYGKAEIIHDIEKAKQLWSPMVKTWFPQGPDDPELTIIKVQPSEAYYWDTKSHKLVAFLKIIAGAVLGKEMDDSIQGKLKVD